MQQGPLAPVGCAPQSVTKTWLAGAHLGMVGGVGCIGRCITGYHAIFCALPAIRPSLPFQSRLTICSGQGSQWDQRSSVSFWASDVRLSSYSYRFPEATNLRQAS